LETQTSSHETKLNREVQEKKRFEETVTKVRAELHALQGEYDTAKETAEKSQKQVAALESRWKNLPLIFAAS